MINYKTNPFKIGDIVECLHGPFSKQGVEYRKLYTVINTRREFIFVKESLDPRAWQIGRFVISKESKVQQLLKEVDDLQAL